MISKYDKLLKETEIMNTISHLKHLEGKTR